MVRRKIGSLLRTHQVYHTRLTKRSFHVAVRGEKRSAGKAFQPKRAASRLELGFVERVL